MGYDGSMPLSAQHWCGLLLAIAPLTLAHGQEPAQPATPAKEAKPAVAAVPLVRPAQEPAPSSIPATPLVKPGQEPAPSSIPATPLMQPGQKPTEATAALPLIRPGQAAAPSSASVGFRSLELEYNAEYSAWVGEITKLSQQDNFRGPYPAEPTANYYARFREHADLGNVSARLWCLRNFSHDDAPEKYRKLRWQGEAFSLATAVRNDVKQSAQLRQSVGSGWKFGANATDKVLEYLHEVTVVEEIKRATMMARSRNMLDSDGETYELGRELAKEVIKTWPASDEAARLDGMLNARDTLVIGGTPANFTGTDVDGNEINLYDYRGKVVLIDFWGFW